MTIEAFGVGETDLTVGAMPSSATADLSGDASLHLVDTGAIVHLEALGAAETVPDDAARPGLLGAAAWQLFVKRGIDIVGSFVLLGLMLPVLLLTAAAIRLSSRGPALFTQERIGRDGRPFRIIKFRSMHLGAHETRLDISHLNEATGLVFKMRKDPRITRVGRIIRRLSIDEIPQLLNVLRGEMSLVGPRPPLPEEFQLYGAREHRRLDVVPGLTCIWQVSGRSDIDFETWVDMDIEYIETWTIRRDLVLLLKTIPAVVTGRGAY